MAGNAIVLKPGETVTVVATNGTYPDNTLPMPQPPVGVWPGPHPSHPIMLPGMPGFGPPLSPTHPWVPPQGGQPGVPPPYPDQGLPGPQPHPEHPIYIPAPPTEPPSPPLQIWGGPYFPPEPTHPIVLPPEVAPPNLPDGRPIDWKVAWTPTTGWIVVGIPSGPHPVPSK